jgi:hypothetical protein
MTRNLGNTEQIIRIVLGLAFIAFGYLTQLPTWGALSAYAVGVVLLLTGAGGFCPLWKLLGVNTCPIRSVAKR